MYDPRFELACYDSLHPAIRARVTHALVEALIAADVAWLEEHPETPKLYESGVRYSTDVVDHWQDIPRTLHLRKGDCEDFTAWRCAELRMAGEHAEPRVTAYEMSGGRVLYHVDVRRADDSIEDPSITLGMPFTDVQQIRSEKRVAR